MLLPVTLSRILDPQALFGMPLHQFPSLSRTQGKEGQELIKATALRDHVGFTWMCEMEPWDQGLGGRKYQ